MNGNDDDVATVDGAASTSTSMDAAGLSVLFGPVGSASIRCLIRRKANARVGHKRMESRTVVPTVSRGSTNSTTTSNTIAQQDGSGSAFGFVYSRVEGWFLQMLWFVVFVLECVRRVLRFFSMSIISISHAREQNYEVCDFSTENTNMLSFAIVSWSIATITRTRNFGKIDTNISHVCGRIRFMIMLNTQCNTDAHRTISEHPTYSPKRPPPRNQHTGE